MPPRRLFPTALLLLAITPLARGAVPDWTQLKPGMKPEETARQLGEPLIRGGARGFERWIYDGRGEVLFAGGPVKAWTVASPTVESLGRPVALDVLIKPTRRVRLAPTPSLAPRTYQDVSTTRFRYLQ